MEQQRKNRNWTLILAIGAGALLLLVLLPLLFMGLMFGGMMGSGGMGGMFGRSGPMMGVGWLMMLFPLLLVVGVMLMVVWGIQRSRRPPAQTGGDDSLAIVERRYARGDISREEYERIRSGSQGREDNRAGN